MKMKELNAMSYHSYNTNPDVDSSDERPYRAGFVMGFKEATKKSEEVECSLVWDLGDKESFRSSAAGMTIYNMNCGSCLMFVAAASKPKDIAFNYCPHCGRKIKKR